MFQLKKGKEEVENDWDREKSVGVYLRIVYFFEKDIF